MDEKKQKNEQITYARGIRKSKIIEDKGQIYDILNKDLINIINKINKNFNFKIFNKDTLKDVEIVRIFFISFFIVF